MITKITNAKLITNEIVSHKNLYIEDGTIASVTEDNLPYDVCIDGAGLYVSPGFIDIHTHGAGGYDFADGSVEDILKAASTHAKYGTTTIFPTCTSSSTEDICRFIQNVKEAMLLNAPGRPFIAGSHLEGPYFSLSMNGAQNPDYIKSPTSGEYESFVALGEGTVKRISFAPELPGTDALMDFLNKNDIVAAFGHTDAIYEELKPAIDKGCHLATHLYSGMNTVTRRNLYRKLGAVETTFLEDAVTAEIIADGEHLPPELLRLIYKIKGPDKVCLITDSMRAAATSDGPSILGPKHDGMSCTIKNGVAWLDDMSAFAGSIATADRLVRVMYKSGIPLRDCIKMMCETPAKTMRLTDRGRIHPGYKADLVFFDEDIHIHRVIAQGMEIN
ncbi:MAG: N-acetylglucosamine-6-phosphate deacetylase [Lachnospiraceae bacterium]|nr:N-acetylglucosamine-6-phosphate deacetylase [Lachnospiraceae bacterium]